MPACACGGQVDVYPRCAHLLKSAVAAAKLVVFSAVGSKLSRMILQFRRAKPVGSRGRAEEKG
jgi:hypothetical protein